jgi:hypothetical protein
MNDKMGFFRKKSAELQRARLHGVRSFSELRLHNIVTGGKFQPEKSEMLSITLDLIPISFPYRNMGTEREISSIRYRKK